MSGGHLRRLTSLRWFAALAVFTDHAAQHHPGTELLVVGGPVGVGFFFVLSGFVLTWSMPDDDTPQAFWRRRFARIYPATAASILATVLLAWLAVRPFRAGPWVLADLGLVQSWFPTRAAVDSGNPVTWSLACEAFFYALLPYLLPAVRRRPRTALTVALAGILAGTTLTLTADTAATYFNPAARMPEFLIGTVLAVKVQSGWRPRTPMFPAVLVFAASWLLASKMTVPYAHLVQAQMALVGVVFVLAAAIGSDLAGRDGWLTSRAMVYLGEVSFCFYLTHYPSQRVVNYAIGDPVLLAVVSFPVALAAAIALHHGVELPAQARILRKRQLAGCVSVNDVMSTVTPTEIVVVDRVKSPPPPVAVTVPSNTFAPVESSTMKHPAVPAATPVTAAGSVAVAVPADAAPNAGSANATVASSVPPGSESAVAPGEPV